MKFAITCKNLFLSFVVVHPMIFCLFETPPNFFVNYKSVPPFLTCYWGGGRSPKAEICTSNSVGEGGMVGDCPLDFITPSLEWWVLDEG